MRFKLLLCSATLVPAALLAGCGVNQMATVAANVESPAIAGQAFGGQAPLVGATISVVEMGTSGYGSTGIILASTITDSGGNFTFAQNAYTCPQSDTPVYLLGIGGNSGFGNNGSAVNAAALGTCTNAKQSFVVMNEVTTAVTATVLSHFFSTTFGGANGANDWFGGPSSGSAGSMVYSKGLVMGSNVTIPTVVNNSSGSVNANSSTITIEASKINTIADILAACVNTSGSLRNGQPCQQLFKFTTTPSGQVPNDTLQAAVSMALNPALTPAKMQNLFDLITSQAPFNPSLSSPPNDWTIGVSYTSPAVGLAVDTGTTSTLDIDGTGNVWFPSNAAGAAGAAYFNPATQTFFGPFNTTALLHPQQVAIDANSLAWYNDSLNSAVSGYLTTAPATTQTVALPGTVSTALSVGGDDRISVGLTLGAIFEMANISPDRSNYSLLPGISFPLPATSVAGDTSNGVAVGTTDNVTTKLRDYYVSSALAETDVVNANADSGQVLYTGNDDVAIRSYPGSGKTDGLCIYSTAACYNFAGSANNFSKDQGIAIDGGKQLWVAESARMGVLQVPVNNSGATGAAVYLNAGGANVPVNEFLHDGSDGETATATAPYGIGVDATGNVWVTNAGCATTGCTPGSFTLTEIVGAGFPTITPVSAQITSGNRAGTEPTN